MLHIVTWLASVHVSAITVAKHMSANGVACCCLCSRHLTCGFSRWAPAEMATLEVRRQSLHHRSWWSKFSCSSCSWHPAQKTHTLRCNHRLGLADCSLGATSTVDLKTAWQSCLNAGPEIVTGVLGMGYAMVRHSTGGVSKPPDQTKIKRLQKVQKAVCKPIADRESHRQHSTCRR